MFDHYTVEYTFADGAKLFAFSRHMPNCWETYADYAHGSKGSAVIMANLGQPEPEDLQEPEDGQGRGRLGIRPGPTRTRTTRSGRCCWTPSAQDKPHNEARRAGEADLAALMGRMATHTGRYVTWDEALNSNFEYVADIDHMTMDTPAPIQAGPDGIYAAPQPGAAKEI